MYMCVWLWDSSCVWVHLLLFLLFPAVLFFQRSQELRCQADEIRESPFVSNDRMFCFRLKCSMSQRNNDITVFNTRHNFSQWMAKHTFPTPLFSTVHLKIFVWIEKGVGEESFYTREGDFYRLKKYANWQKNRVHVYKQWWMGRTTHRVWYQTQAESWLCYMSVGGGIVFWEGEVTTKSLIITKVRIGFSITVRCNNSPFPIIIR